jgi:hypothetical protein
MVREGTGKQAKGALIRKISDVVRLKKLQVNQQRVFGALR